MNRTNLVLTFRSTKQTTKYYGESSLEQISRASDIIIAESGVFNSTDREQFREYVRQRTVIRHNKKKIKNKKNKTKRSKNSNAK